MSVGVTMFIRHFSGSSQELRNVINLNPDITILSINQISSIEFKVTVANGEQARFLKNFHGMPFRSDVIQVDYIDEPIKSEQFKFVLENIKHEFCDIMNRHLDLSHFLQKLKKYSFVPDKQFDELFRDALKYFYNQIPDLLVLDISNNDISNTYFFDELKYGFKQLDTLDISNNKISSFLCFIQLKDLSLRSLNTYGNPLPHELPIEIISNFPTLEYHNNFSIRKDFFPITVKREVQPIIYNTFHPYNEGRFNDFYKFISTYLQLFDTDREKLAPLYCDMSYFDITLNDGIRINNIQSRSTTPNDFERLTRTLKRGAMNIIPYMQLLGKTQHRMSDICFDVVDYGQMYVVTLQGKMKMNYIEYYFCRSMVLLLQQAPIITNDHLQIYDGAMGFLVTKTFSPYIHHMKHTFPGMNDREALLALERHNFNVYEAVQDVSNFFNRTPLKPEEVSPQNMLGGEFSTEDLARINPQYVEKLIDIGIPRQKAMRALLQAGNNIDLAAQIAFQMNDEAQLYGQFGISNSSQIFDNQLAMMSNEMNEFLKTCDIVDEQHITQIMEITNAAREICIQSYKNANKNVEVAVNMILGGIF